MQVKTKTANVAIVGAGPAGLMAAEVLSRNGVQVDVYDAMPSVGRKFLLAGIGGLNLTHSEPFEPFMSRYGARRAQLEPMVQAFDADALRDWVHGLGIETFVGTSGRVFPKEMKAAPLLRAWLHRLRQAGVRIHVRHRCLGWDNSGCLRLRNPEGEIQLRPDALILALGGGSWSKLGSDGAWVPWLTERGVDVAPLLPSNCGFDCAWRPFFSERFAGEPLKSVAITLKTENGEIKHKQGEFVVTRTGVEGSLIYAFSAQIRDQIEREGKGTIYLDLLPGRDQEKVFAEVNHPRGSRSLSTHLQSRLGLKGVKAGLLRELLSKEQMNDPTALTHSIKALPLNLIAARPLDEAISSAGGIRFSAMDEHLMLKAMPGVFCAGEMLDWEAPTGGYLLTACFASGRQAGLGVLSWLDRRSAE